MDSSIRELQLVLFQMLKDVDIICKEYDIKYSLACGTALGAIRHQGFIPWDDDLDIMFMREDYKKFLEVAPTLLKEKGYTLQQEFTDTWPMHYSKVRKDNTTYLEDFKPKIKEMHQGVFIDLFPIDNLSDNIFIANLQWKFFHALVAKGMKKRGYKTNSLSKKIVMFFSPLFPEKMLRNFVMLENHTCTSKVHCFLGGAVVRSHNMFPREIFNEYIQVSFEGELFSIVKDYDIYLKICFDEYMKLPPLDKRQSHIHALKFDLEKSYTHYQSFK